MKRKIFQTLVALAILVGSFASVGSASAWTRCPSFITVQWGDTLSGIAARCGVTIAAIQAANPGLGWWLYAGQLLYIPSIYNPAPTRGSTYVVQWGDTLGTIAWRFGVTVADILAVNPQISNPNLIYAGQVIYLPAGTYAPPPPVYTPPPPVSTPTPTNCNCPPAGFISYGTLRVAYGPGLFVRADPGGPIILASAMDKTLWYYNLNTVFVDKKFKVWAQVNLYPSVKGYSTGWILVRDQFGKFFTEPHISN